MKSKSITKVLIALDYDPTAQKIAEIGFSLARAIGANTILLHVISDPLYYSSREYSPVMGYTGFMDLSQSELENMDGLKKASEQYLDRLKHHLGDEDIQTLVAEGDIAESILKAAKIKHADIIVLGYNSQKWLENMLVGSVTEKVLKNSGIPLFIIPLLA